MLLHCHKNLYVIYVVPTSFGLYLLLYAFIQLQLLGIVVYTYVAHSFISSSFLAPYSLYTFFLIPTLLTLLCFVQLA